MDKMENDIIDKLKVYEKNHDVIMREKNFRINQFEEAIRENNIDNTTQKDYKDKFRINKKENYSQNNSDLEKGTANILTETH